MVELLQWVLRTQVFQARIFVPRVELLPRLLDQLSVNMAVALCIFAKSIFSDPPLKLEPTYPTPSPLKSSLLAGFRHLFRIFSPLFQ